MISQVLKDDCLAVSVSSIVLISTMFTTVVDGVDKGEQILDSESFHRAIDCTGTSFYILCYLKNTRPIICLGIMSIFDTYLRISSNKEESYILYIVPVKNTNTDLPSLLLLIIVRFVTQNMDSPNVTKC